MRAMLVVLLALSVFVTSVTFADAAPRRNGYYHHDSDDYERPVYKKRYIKKKKPKPAKIRIDPVPPIVRHQSEGNLLADAMNFVGMGARQLGLPLSLWCADFINMLTGSGTDRTARSYMKRGTKADPGCVGCVVVLTRTGGGHVGVVKDYDKRGNPIVVSGNSTGRKVAIGMYPKQIMLGIVG